MGSTLKKKKNQPTIELHIHCKNLPKMDRWSESDPFCVIHLVRSGAPNEPPFDLQHQTPPREPDMMREVEVGKTEVIMDTPNPDFCKPVTLPYHFEQEQILCVRVHDKNEKTTGHHERHDYIGGFYCTVGNILGSKGNALAKQLQKDKKYIIKRRKELPLCTVVAEAVKSNNNEVLHFQLSGRKLLNMDGIFGKSDPFYVFKRINPDGETWNTVYKSKVLRNTLAPEWEPDQIPIHELCNGDHNRRLQIQLVDWDSNGDHDDMGYIETTVAELTSSSKDMIEFSVSKRTKKNGTIQQGGTLTFRQVHVEKKPTMLDYISGGCDISLMVAVDFSISNGLPHDPNSKHRMSSDHGMNEYQRAITKIGNIIQEYDTDKQFPIWGMGLGKNSTNPLPEQEVHGTEGLLDAYKRAFEHPNFERSCYTYLEPVVEEARVRALKLKANVQEKQAYSVLVVLTDGKVSDLPKAVNKICEIANDATAPLSIIIVGVGKADFSGMQRLDGDDDARLRDYSTGRRAARDIVQFVPFRQFEFDATKLAEQTLKEVPDQLVQYFQNLGIDPNPALCHNTI